MTYPASNILSFTEVGVESAINQVSYALFQDTQTMTADADSRPGDRPAAFTADFAGSPANTAPIEGNHPGVTQGSIAGLGNVMLVENVAIAVARRVPVAVQVGRVYRLHAYVKRIVDPVDPVGDTVRLGCERLNAAYASLGNLVIEDAVLRTTDGVMHLTGTLSFAAGTDVVIPAGTVYLRPFVRVYGSNSRTAIIQIEADDITEIGQINGALDAIALADAVADAEAAAVATAADRATVVASAASATAAATAAATYDPTLRFATVAALLASTRGAATVGTVWQAAGHFYSQAASGATDHHVTTAGGSKLYVTPGSRGYDAKAFGATGNGVTDDTVPIQKWLNVGPFVKRYLPAGVYVCSPLTCGAEVTIEVEVPYFTQLRLKAGSTGNLLTATNALHLHIKGLGFDGNQANCPAGGTCLTINGVEGGGNGYWLDECGFFNARSIGLYQVGTYTKARVSGCIAEGCLLDGMAISATSAVVQNNRCVANGRFGILIFGNHTQVVGNTSQSNGQLVTQGAGIGFIGCDHVVCANNNALSNGTGAFFTHGIQFNDVRNGVMSGNFSQGNNGSGLDMYQSPYSTCTGNQSVGNIVRGIENDTTSTYSVIDGNVVHDNFEIGISVFNTIGSIVSNNIVTNNGRLGVAANPMTGVTNLPYGVALWGAGNYGNFTTLVGNQISQNNGGGSGTGVGVWIDPACANVTMKDNQLAANTTAMTAVLGNFLVVRDNFGIETEQSGVASLGAGATSVTVTFPTPMRFAPSIGNLTLTLGSLPFSNIGPMGVTGLSTTGFTINTFAAPGGSGLLINWSCKAFA